MVVKGEYGLNAEMVYQDKVGCVKSGLSLLKLQINGFGLWIVLVVRNGEGAECADVYKDLQYWASPYRYLS